MAIRSATLGLVVALASHLAAGEPVPTADEVMLVTGKTVPVRPLRDPFDGKASPEELIFHATTKPEKVTLRRDEIVGVRYFEQAALARVDVVLKDAAEKDALLAAETLLQTTLRAHLGERLHVPFADNPWQPLQRQLADRLEEVRCRYLVVETAKDVVLSAIERWRPIYSESGSFRNTMRDVWVRLGLEAVQKEEFKEAADFLRRLEEEFTVVPQAEKLRAALQSRSETLLKLAEGQSDTQALATLKQANELFPRLPGLQDALARKQGNDRPLYVAVRSLPEMMSPTTASTDTERQVLDLLFEPLVRPRIEVRQRLAYEPVLAATFPEVKGRVQAVEIVRGAWWTETEPVSAADIRHTIRLNLGAKLQGRDPFFRELFEPVRWEGQPRHIELEPRQGLFDSLEPLNFFILPQAVRGKPLTKADDAEFARQPLGSGPFRYLGRVQENQQTYAVFGANPAYASRQRGQVREVRLFVPGKTLQPPLPHVVLDMPGLAKGYRESDLPAWRRVFFVAMNHRRPDLAKVNLRRFLALALDREKILRDIFPGEKGLATALNGPFPLESWATCRPPRVPHSLFQPELARTLAREMKKEADNIRLSFKYPNDDPRIDRVCRAAVESWERIAQAAGLDLRIEPQPLSPREAKNALDQRDYDLIYQRHDFTSAAFTLWPLFDVHPSALEPGGSNYLGYENDARLLRLLQTALKHRHFETLQELTHDIHAHLNERMPLVPLWQVPCSIATMPGVEIGSVDPLRPFARVQDWRLPASK